VTWLALMVVAIGLHSGFSCAGFFLSPTKCRCCRGKDASSDAEILMPTKCRRCGEGQGVGSVGRLACSVGKRAAF